MNFKLFKSQKGKQPAGDIRRKMLGMSIEYLSMLFDTPPANGLPVVVKSADGNFGTVQLNAAVVSKSEKEGIVYATVYEPNKVDLQGDWTDEKEIEKAAHAFLSKARQGHIDVEHNLVKGAGTVVESFILQGNDDRFPNIAKGAWCVGVKLSDELKAKAEEVKGISLYGTCKYADAAAQKSVAGEELLQKGNSEWLRELRTQADVGDTTVAKTLGLSLEEYAAIESGEQDFEWTPEALQAIAKQLKLKAEVVAAAALNGTAPKAEDNQDDAGDPTDGNNPDQIDSTQKSFPNTDMKSINNQKKLLKYTAGMMNVGGNAGADTPIGTLPEAERRAEVFKGMVRVNSEVRLSKTVPIVPGSFDVGGTVAPELGTEIISIWQKDDGFLQNIQIKEMTSLKEQVPIMNIIGRKMRRFTERGSIADGSLVGLENVSRELSCADVDVAWNIPNSLLNNYQGRFPQLEAFIGGGMNDLFRTDLVDLGFNGTTDTYADSFLSLAKGWFVIARTDAPAWRIVDKSGEGFTDILQSMDKAIANMAANNPKYATPTTSFILGSADWEQYEKEILAHPGAFNVMVEGAKGSYRGHPVYVVPAIPADSFFYTPIKNFVAGIVTQGANGIRVENMKQVKSMDWIMTAAVDFDLVDPDAAICGQA